MTPINYGRNVKAYQRIAQATGVHVICCTGFHKQLFMPPWFGDKTDGELYDILMNEVTNGLMTPRSTRVLSSWAPALRK